MDYKTAFMFEKLDKILDGVSEPKDPVGKELRGFECTLHPDVYTLISVNRRYSSFESDYPSLHSISVSKSGHIIPAGDTGYFDDLMKHIMDGFERTAERGYVYPRLSGKTRWPGSRRYSMHEGLERHLRDIGRMTLPLRDLFKTLGREDEYWLMAGDDRLWESPAGRMAYNLTRATRVPFSQEAFQAADDLREFLKRQSSMSLRSKAYIERADVRGYFNDKDCLRQLLGSVVDKVLIPNREDMKWAHDQEIYPRLKANKLNLRVKVPTEKSVAIVEGDISSFTGGCVNTPATILLMAASCETTPSLQGPLLLHIDTFTIETNLAEVFRLYYFLTVVADFDTGPTSVDFSFGGYLGVKGNMHATMRYFRVFKVYLRDRLSEFGVRLVPRVGGDDFLDILVGLRSELSLAISMVHDETVKFVGRLSEWVVSHIDLSRDTTILQSLFCQKEVSVTRLRNSDALTLKIRTGETIPLFLRLFLIHENEVTENDFRTLYDALQGFKEWPWDTAYYTIAPIFLALWQDVFGPIPETICHQRPKVVDLTRYPVVGQHCLTQWAERLVRQTVGGDLWLTLEPEERVERNLKRLLGVGLLCKKEVLSDLTTIDELIMHPNERSRYSYTDHVPVDVPLITTQAVDHAVQFREKLDKIKSQSALWLS